MFIALFVKEREHVYMRENESVYVCARERRCYGIESSDQPFGQISVSIFSFSFSVLHVSINVQIYIFVCASVCTNQICPIAFRLFSYTVQDMFLHDVCTVCARDGEKEFAWYRVSSSLTRSDCLLFCERFECRLDISDQNEVVKCVDCAMKTLHAV